jgi:hypothetical protein
MGTDIASRRQYIETYARQVQNLDIWKNFKFYIFSPDLLFVIMERRTSVSLFIHSNYFLLFLVPKGKYY